MGKIEKIVISKTFESEHALEFVGDEGRIMFTGGYNFEEAQELRDIIEQIIRSYI